MLNKLVALSTEPPKNPVRRVTIYYVPLLVCRPPYRAVATSA